jgi:hypothetical protein
MLIDYAAAQKLFVKHKGLLTRATKKGYPAVLAACTQFVRDFAAIDAPWPDDWSRWQRALEDAAVKHHRETGVFVNVPRLEDLR